MSLPRSIDSPNAPLKKIDFQNQYQEYNTLPCVSHLDDGKSNSKRKKCDGRRSDGTYVKCEEKT